MGKSILDSPIFALFLNFFHMLASPQMMQIGGDEGANGTISVCGSLNEELVKNDTWSLTFEI